MTDMTTDTEKIDRILTIVEDLRGRPAAAPAGALQPYEVPELPLSAIDPGTIDAKTVQADGSTWAYQTQHGAFMGGPVQVIYGYISKAKNPALWDRLVAAFGGDEARLQSLIDANGKLARYRMHPEWAAQGVGAERFQRLSMILSNPTPPTPPTIGAAAPAAPAPAEKPAAPPVPPPPAPAIGNVGDIQSAIENHPDR